MLTSFRGHLRVETRRTSQSMPFLRTSFWLALTGCLLGFTLVYVNGAMRYYRLCEHFNDLIWYVSITLQL